jgi:hypothetical protein
MWRGERSGVWIVRTGTSVCYKKIRYTSGKKMNRRKDST